MGHLKVNSGSSRDRARAVDVTGAFLFLCCDLEAANFTGCDEQCGE